MENVEIQAHGLRYHHKSYDALEDQTHKGVEAKDQGKAVVLQTARQLGAAFLIIKNSFKKKEEWDGLPDHSNGKSKNGAVEHKARVGHIDVLGPAN